VALFVRGKNAVTLTDRGALFYEEARDLLARGPGDPSASVGDAQRDSLRGRLHAVAHGRQSCRARLGKFQAARRACASSSPTSRRAR